MPRFRLVRVVAPWFLAVCFAGFASGQEVPEQPPAAQDVAPDAVRVNVTSLATHVDDLRSEMREIRARSGAWPEQDQIEAEFEDLVDSIDVARRRLEDRGLATMSGRELQNSLRVWERFERQCDEWGLQLDSRSGQLDSDLTTLVERGTSWQAALDSIGEQQLPEAVAARFQEVREEIDRLEAELRDPLGEALTFLKRVSDQRTTVRDMLDQLRAAELEARNRVLAVGQPALWQLLSPATERQTLGSQVRAAWEVRFRELSDFVAVNAVRGVAHGGLYVLLLILLVRLRRYALARVEEDPSLQPSIQVVGLPVAAASLVAILATKWIYASAPDVVYELALLLALLPIMRLLPALTPQVAHRPIYVLGGLSVLARITEFSGDQTLLGRLFLLLQSLLAIAFIVWLTRPGRPTATVPGTWWRLIRGMTRFALIPLVASVVANVFGAVALARILSSGALMCAYFAAILFAGVQVMGGIIAVSLRTGVLRRSRVVRRYTDVIQRRAGFVLRVGAMAWWVWGSLNVFGIEVVVVAAMTTLLTQEWGLGTVSITLGRVLAFGVTVWGAVLIAGFVRVVLEDDVLDRVRLPRGVPGTISMMVRYGTVAIGLGLAFGVLGVDLSHFAFLVGALSVGIGFGLQDVVNNFVSGLILAFERPIQIGDTIEAGKWIGVVRHIGVRSSTLRSLEGAEVVIPNGNLVSAEVVNWTLSDKLRRLEIKVGVAYGTDPRRVTELLLGVAKDQPKVLASPGPAALFDGFGESSLDFKLRIWTADFDNWRQVRSDITVAVSEALAEAGIQIPFPQRDLHLRSGAFEQKDAP